MRTLVEEKRRSQSPSPDVQSTGVQTDEQGGPTLVEEQRRSQSPAPDVRSMGVQTNEQDHPMTQDTLTFARRVAALQRHIVHLQRYNKATQTDEERVNKATQTDEEGVDKATQTDASPTALSHYNELKSHMFPANQEKPPQVEKGAPETSDEHHQHEPSSDHQSQENPSIERRPQENPLQTRVQLESDLTKLLNQQRRMYELEAKNASPDEAKKILDVADSLKRHVKSRERFNDRLNEVGGIIRNNPDANSEELRESVSPLQRSINLYHTQLRLDVLAQGRLANKGLPRANQENIDANIKIIDRHADNVKNSINKLFEESDKANFFAVVREWNELSQTEIKAREGLGGRPRL